MSEYGRICLNLPAWLFIIIIVIIKTLFTLGLERKIYKNEIITAKGKRVIHSSHPKTSRL